MERKKATQESIKERNLGLILKLIKENKNFSRAKLSTKTGLSKSTISGLVDTLINKGIIAEGDKINSSRGKKPTLLKFNKNYCYIAAINLGIKFMTMVIADLSGEIIYRNKEKNFSINSVSNILKKLFSLVEKALGNTKIDIEDIYLFSIGTHGIVEPATSKVLFAPYLPELQGVNLAELIKEKYNKEVIIENSVNLGALAEHWKRKDEIKNLVYLFLHYGIAAGVIIDNKLAVGVNGSMGEIAYMPILKRHDSKKIKRNKPGLGLFESQVDITGIINTIKEELKKHEGPTGLDIDEDINKIDFDDICKYYNKPGNNIIKKTVNGDIIKLLSLGIASLISVIDTEVIIINGRMIDLGEDFINRLKHEVYSITPFKPDIVVSDLKKDASIMGEIKFGLNYMDNLFYSNFFSLS